MIPNPPDVKMKALSNDAQIYSGRLLTHKNFGCNQHEYKTKTTHQMACELLALPDVPLVIETWCTEDDKEMVAEMTGYDPEGTAIIWQKPNKPEDEKIA